MSYAETEPKHYLSIFPVQFYNNSQIGANIDNNKYYITEYALSAHVRLLSTNDFIHQKITSLDHTKPNSYIVSHPKTHLLPNFVFTGSSQCYPEVEKGIKKSSFERDSFVAAYKVELIDAPPDFDTEQSTILIGKSDFFSQQPAKISASTSLRVLTGCAIAASGIALLYIAFAILNASTFGVTGVSVAAVGFFMTAAPAYLAYKNPECHHTTPNSFA